jgi:hypothetical protein
MIPWARDSDAGGQWAQAAALVPVLGGARLHAFAERLGWSVRLDLPPITRLHPAWGGPQLQVRVSPTESAIIPRVGAG